jgi:putative SOS response-associated peptidase YedK
MCGRYTLANPNPRRLKLRFGITESAQIDEEPRYNIAPTDPVLAVRQEEAERELGTLRWGLIPGKWAAEKKGRPLINARAETLDRQPAFAESFRERRCLIPADGFYEWRRNDKGKVPIWVHLPEDGLFAFAGIWASYEPRDGEPIVSCSIVTTEPNEAMGTIHDRMPVILPRESETEWLAADAKPEELKRLLVPYEGELATREVSDLVNSVREDGPELIEPRAEATLF